MKLAKLAVAFPVLFAAATPASAASITGQAALALAGVVALYAPMPAANKKAVAALFKGDTKFPVHGEDHDHRRQDRVPDQQCRLNARSCESPSRRRPKC